MQPERAGPSPRPPASICARPFRPDGARRARAAGACSPTVSRRRIRRRFADASAGRASVGRRVASATRARTPAARGRNPAGRAASDTVSLTLVERAAQRFGLSERGSGRIVPRGAHHRRPGRVCGRRETAFRRGVPVRRADARTGTGRRRTARRLTSRHARVDGRRGAAAPRARAGRPRRRAARRRQRARHIAHDGHRPRRGARGRADGARRTRDPRGGDLRPDRVRRPGRDPSSG